MNTNKKELFLNLINEYKKLRNLEAKYPELQNDFNTIANQNILTQIDVLIKKQQQKAINNQNVAVAANNQEDNTIEEHGDKDKIENWTVLKSLLQGWKISQMRPLSHLQKNTLKISTITLKDDIKNNINYIPKSSILNEIYGKFLNSLKNDLMAINEIATAFSTILDSYKFDDENEEQIKNWFKQNKDWYKSQTINNFKDYLLDLTELIKSVAEAADRKDQKHKQFDSWYKHNHESIVLLKEKGYISLATLSEQILSAYANTKCDFIADYLLVGVDNTIPIANIEAVKKHLLGNMEVLKKNITTQQKDNVCTIIDSSNATHLGGMIRASIKNNMIDSLELQKIMKESINNAKSKINGVSKYTQPTVDIKGFLSNVKTLLSQIEDKWIHSVIFDCIKPLYQGDDRDFKLYSECRNKLSEQMDNIMNNFEHYHAYCLTMPKTGIPLDSIVNFLIDNTIEINTYNILKIHQDWYVGLGLLELPFSNSTQLHKLTLIGALSDAFSRKPLGINLPFQWLEKHILSKLGKGDSIQWSKLKEIFGEKLSDSFLKDFLDNLVAQNDIDKVIFILKYWVDYLPSKTELTTALYNAKNYYNTLQPKPQKLATNPVVVKLINDKMGIMLDLNLHIDTKIEYKQDGTSFTTGNISKYETKMTLAGNRNGFNTWEIDSQFEQPIDATVENGIAMFTVTVPLKYTQNKTTTKSETGGFAISFLSGEKSEGEEYSQETSGVLINKIKFSVKPDVDNNESVMKINIESFSKHNIFVLFENSGHEVFELSLLNSSNKEIKIPLLK